MTGVFKRARDLLGKPAPETPLVPRRAAKAHHAVSILPGPQACAAAQALVSKRYLSREAPILPLKACDQGQCSCRYAHHDDRRKGPRRANELGISIDGYEGRDKRTSAKRGRRKTDT
jgi:hypothetical protein